MSAGLPETLDAWRMLAARRCFEGSLPLASMLRLRDALDQPELEGGGGECRYQMEFDCGPLDVPYVEIRVQAELPLICQRSLQRFLLPVRIVQRLALVTRDEQEAELPEGYEMVQPEADGTIRPRELIEDELILAVPVVPMDPSGDPVDMTWPPVADAVEDAPRKNPFAVLAEFKQTSSK
jgi:uncharacterized protein